MISARQRCQENKGVLLAPFCVIRKKRNYSEPTYTFAKTACAAVCRFFEALFFAHAQGGDSIRATLRIK